ncbi:ribosomal protein L1/ribosomal biogenesis protein [Fennellomyces sp. T-0311]|nr:ribosomal protein L1/ribosomal biogenesis protein [Fennellomyces sp. T-0311]
MAAVPEIKNLDQDLVKKAIHALSQYKESQESNDLLSTTSYIYLDIVTMKFSAKQQRSLKQTVIPVKHSPYPSDIEACLIVNNESKDELEQSLRKADLKNVKVYTLDEIKSNSQYEARRKLAASYDVFFVDKRILHFMPQVLGKTFVKANKIPLPVSVERKGTAVANVQKALSSVTFKDNNGTTKVVKIGHMELKEEEVVDNVLTVLPRVVAKLQGGQSNVQEIAVRMDNITLPVYNALPSN